MVFGKNWAFCSAGRPDRQKKSSISLLTTEMATSEQKHHIQAPDFSLLCLATQKHALTGQTVNTQEITKMSLKMEIAAG